MLFFRPKRSPTARRTGQGCWPTTVPGRHQGCRSPLPCAAEISPEETLHRGLQRLPTSRTSASAYSANFSVRPLMVRMYT